MPALDPLYESLIKSEQDFIDHIEKELKKIIRDTQVYVNSGIRTDEPKRMNIEISFPTNNNSLLTPKYFPKGTKTLLHFTDLKALFSILNEKAIRFYNLNNSNDPHEYDYVIKQLKFEFHDHNYVEYSKDNTFILSSTNLNEVHNQSLWKRYAKRGTGVAIEFEILNEPLNWENFYLSNVNYGEIHDLKRLYKKLVEYKLKYPESKFIIKFDHLFGLHKKPIKKWKNEKEIRIITFTSLDINPLKNNVFTDVKISNNIFQTTQYYKLLLYTGNKDNTVFKDPKVPLIKIRRIFFGYNCYENQYALNNIMRKVHETIKYNFGYKLETNDLQKISLEFPNA